MTLGGIRGERHWLLHAESTDRSLAGDGDGSLSLGDDGFSAQPLFSGV